VFIWVISENPFPITGEDQREVQITQQAEKIKIFSFVSTFRDMAGRRKNDFSLTSEGISYLLHAEFSVGGKGAEPVWTLL